MYCRFHCSQICRDIHSRDIPPAMGDPLGDKLKPLSSAAILTHKVRFVNGILTKNYFFCFQTAAYYYI